MKKSKISRKSANLKKPVFVKSQINKSQINPHHKTHLLGTAIVILILISAVIGLYFAFNPAGKAIQMSESNVDTVGFCCCKDTSVFKVPSTKLQSQLTPTDCSVVCYEHNSLSVGQC